MKKIKRAMVLSAGLGTRLLPLTESTPKPLLPVLNLPNIVHTLFWLKEHGIEEVVFNLYHLHEKLESFLTQFQNWRMKISLSKETILLGTGGGVKKAEKFFKGEPFLLCNCDFICDFNLTEAISNFLDSDTFATMILLEDKEKQKVYSRVGVNAQSLLCELPKKKTLDPVRSGIFTGVHLLRPEALAPLKEEPCGINEILYPYFMEKNPSKVMGVFTKGIWLDTGEKKTYLESNLALIKKMPPLTEKLLKDQGYQKVGSNWQKDKQAFNANNCVIDSGFQANGGSASSCIIGKNVSLSSETKITDCLVLSETEIKKASEKKILAGPHIL